MEDNLVEQAWMRKAFLMNSHNLLKTQHLILLFCMSAALPRHVFLHFNYSSSPPSFFPCFISPYAIF